MVASPDRANPLSQKEHKFIAGQNYLRRSGGHEEADPTLTLTTIEKTNHTLIIVA